MLSNVKTFTYTLYAFSSNLRHINYRFITDKIIIMHVFYLFTLIFLEGGYCETYGRCSIRISHLCQWESC